MNQNRQQEEVGYKSDYEIPFWRIKENSSSVTGFPKVSAEDIFKTKIGKDVPEIDEECLRAVPDLSSIIKKIIKNTNKTDFRKIELDKVDPKSDTLCGLKCRLSRDSYISLIRLGTPEGVEEKQAFTLESESFERGKFSLEGSRLHFFTVYRALLKIIQFVIPTSFWGTNKKNFKVMKNAIKHIILLGNKDKLFIGDILRGINFSNFSWAKSLGTYFKVSYVVAKIWVWIVCFLIMETMKALFYITVCKSKRHQMIYFRKNEWRSIHDSEIQSMVKQNILVLVNVKKNKAKKDLQRNLKNPHSSRHLTSSIQRTIVNIPRLKFLPKMNGVRPITMSGKKCSVFTSEEIQKINLILDDCRDLHKSMITTLKGTGDLCAIWENYCKTLDSNKELYAIRADFKNTYGSLKHKIIIEILDEYLSIGITTLNFKKLISGNKIIFKKTNEERPSALGSFLSIDVPSLVGKLQIYIQTQFVCVYKDTVYHVKQGIPQGGLLSAKLCDLYLTVVCQKYLTKFCDEESSIVRYVDDILYVSTSKKKATEFLWHVERSMDAFNLKVNNKKTQHNLWQFTSKCLSYCGLVVCTDTRQLLIDTADIISCPPRYTMTLNASTRISQFVEAKFWKVTEARLCKEVLNPSYTKAAGYIANIWRTALMSGARLVSLIETVLKPHDSIDTLILRELVITTAQNIWCLLKRIWKKKGIEVVPGDWPQLSHKPSFHAKTLIYTVFIGGITAVLNVFMKVTKVSELKKKLNSRLKAYLRKIPEQYLRLLPRYFHSLLTSGKAAKTSYAVKSRRADSQ